MNVIDILFSLIRFSINGENVSQEIKHNIDDKMLLKLFQLSKAHDISHLVADSLSKIGSLTDDEISKAFRKQQMLSIYRRVRVNFHLESIKETLKKGKIPFIPLKGAVIKDYYPEEWMRSCCDIDILVKKEDLARATKLLEDDKWQVDKKSYHDISLCKQGAPPLELHFSIKENMENLDRVLEKVWENSVLNEDFDYKMTNEFLLFYLLSHIAFHFKKGGCGIRTILDIWLLKEKLEIDENILKNLCVEAKIDVFADKIIKLSNVWFGKNNHTDITKKMEQFILFGGVYGNKENRVSVEQAMAGGRAKSILRRAVMPYDKMIIRYPVLKKYKFLTPFFHIARWGSVIKKQKLGSAINEYTIASEKTEEDIKNTKELLNEVGLI